MDMDKFTEEDKQLRIYGTEEKVWQTKKIQAKEALRETEEMQIYWRKILEVADAEIVRIQNESK